jgi:hypothetical protein
MTYGLQTTNSLGNITLDISDRTPRLISVTGVTVPTSGSTTVSVSSIATITNSVAVLDNGAEAVVTSTGTVTVYGSQSNSGNTNLKLLVY